MYLGACMYVNALKNISQATPRTLQIMHMYADVQIDVEFICANMLE